MNKQPIVNLLPIVNRSVDTRAVPDIFPRGESMLDKKAVRILMSAYWGAGGWRSGKVSKVDFEYAKEHGLMFDPIAPSHNDLVKNTLAVRKSLSPDTVAAAFLASLSTRQLHLRSPLASYVHTAGLEPHAYKSKSPSQKACQICGASQNYKNANLNELNFERLKWGGVRHDELLYNWFDMSQLIECGDILPSPSDIDILKTILKTIETSQPKDSPSKLAGRLKDVLPSSTEERKTLLEILGCAKILVPQGDYVCQRDSDWNFVQDWRGQDKYDEKQVAMIFGQFL